MASSFGERVTITIFGESHGAGIGVVLDGLPAGERVDLDELAAFLGRRAPGQNRQSTQRREADRPRVLSGLRGGATCGSPLALLIENTDTRSADYASLDMRPRPGHADYTAFLRYGGQSDPRGGGHFSGRLTAPLCAAGGICKQILTRRGVTVGAHIAELAGIADQPFDPVLLTPKALLLPGQRAFPVLDETAGAAMRDAIDKAAADRDSVGGVVECALLGLPGGLGDPMFDGVENRLARVLFGIPAVKGVEFGAGFGAARMRGSENNDPFAFGERGIVTKTNHAGGILGGITSGLPVVARVAFKPTPSIAREQRTVDLTSMTEVSLAVKGRHDPCVVPRAVPCVEAAFAAVALDLILIKEWY